MRPNANRLRLSRETRLLLATIAISVAMLLVLARLRFPDNRRSEMAPARAPIDRLAAPIGFDELASLVGRLEERISDSLLVLQVGARDRADRTVVPPRFVPALRVRDDVALAYLDPSWRAQALAGSSAPLGDPIAVDPVRRLVAVRIPVTPAPTISVLGAPADYVSSRYVALVEGTRGGPSVRPTFVGRVDPLTRPQWDRPLLAIGGALHLEPGTLVFTFDGRLAGAIVDEPEGPALVDGGTLLERANELARGAIHGRAQLGVDVQELTPALQRATSAAAGVVVTRVAAEGPAEKVLKAGDVIEAIDGTRVDAVASFSDREFQMRGGQPARLSIVRLGQRLEVTVVPASPEPRRPASAPPALGLQLGRVPGGSQVTAVSAASVAALAGLEVGDVITAVGKVEAPAPADVIRQYAVANTGSALLVAFSRGGRPHVIALEKP